MRTRMKRMGCVIASWLLCLVLTLFYLFRWDIVYAATVYPAWVYAVAGLAIAAIGRPKPFWKVFRWVLLCWSLFVLAFAEEPRSLLRIGAWPSDEWMAHRGRGSIRVVSLNCAGGTPEAAEEVVAYKPDVVLLQESPGAKEVATLAKELFGKEGVSVPGPDGSIVVRGPVEVLALPPATTDFVAAVVRLQGNLECTIVSLRLTPPELRFDYWNPECWEAYAENLQRRRDELRAIMDWVAVHRRGALILGGDFNAGPTPTLSRVMAHDLRDTFSVAGAGWGHTAINDFPLVRIDKIWVSEEFDVDRAFVRKTVNSDHRMALADLTIK